MAATPYKSVSFTSESITQQKLQQMANNEQWLFENSAKIRYATPALSRDAGIKIISGKIVQPVGPGDFVEATAYFGSFFTAGCKPIVNSTYESGSQWQARFLSVRGIGGEIDHRGFIVRVYSREAPGFTNTMATGGWIHWTAVGY